ncbi:MAG TPA: cyanophycinase [Chitinophagaceae bacterium]|nr:cyanophycinase [Chitinophagaceae bacterium]
MRAHNIIIVTVSLLVSCLFVQAQKISYPKGKLFIIGGGDRSPTLMKSLVVTAGMNSNDYVIVLPMSSASPDTSYYYFKADLKPVCKNPVINFNFTAERVNNKNWLDSLEKAKLIFITGGDQDRFMKAVINTPVYKAIHNAYKNGATIAGTSAGAAVMSQHMITGQELTDTVYRSTFTRIKDKNIEIKPGLGLLTSAVVDQHFIVRSRYNRLLSALAKFPLLTCIGIDEATAIIVQRSIVKVVGESQVIVMQQPDGLEITASGLIKLKDMKFSIYTDGDVFTIDHPKQASVSSDDK